MIVFFDPITSDHLTSIERSEGIPKEELVRQATEVWTQLNADERRATGIFAMRLVVERHQRSA